MNSTDPRPVPSGHALARSRLGFQLLLQAFQVYDLGVIGYLRWHKELSHAWYRERQHRQAYHVLSEGELKASKKSDTVFVFGSGYSLNDITPDEWRHFEQHDTFGFSGFIYQSWIRVDYHLIRGWVEAKAGALNWRLHTQDFANILNANPYFKDTILILQGEYLARFCNTLIGDIMLRPGSRIFRYRTARGTKSLTCTFNKGLNHAIGTLTDAINFAYCMGWKRIVLVGVDLYDSRYFWLKSNETQAVDEATGMLIPSETNNRGIRFDEKHNTAQNGIVQAIAAWRNTLLRDNIMISVYNPRSLLAHTIPVYRIQR